MPFMTEMPIYEPSARAEVRPNEAAESAAKQVLSTEAAVAAQTRPVPSDASQKPAGDKAGLQELKIIGSDVKADAKTMEAALIKYLHGESGAENSNIKDFQKDLQSLADKGKSYTDDVFKQIKSDTSGIRHLFGEMSIGIDTEHGYISAEQSLLDSAKFGATGRSISGAISEHKASANGDYIAKVKPSDESGIPASWHIKPTHNRLSIESDGRISLVLTSSPP